MRGSFRIFSKICGDIHTSRCTTGINDSGGKRWKQYRTADTLKWAWRKKFIYMLNLPPKGVQKSLLKLFWLKIFSIFRQCPRHLWCILSCEYLREFLKKFKTALMVYSGLGGNWFMEKTCSRKSHGTVPLSHKSVPRNLYPCILYLHTRQFYIYIHPTFCTFRPHMLWTILFLLLYLQLYFVVDNQRRCFAMLLHLADTPLFRENKRGV